MDEIVPPTWSKALHPSIQPIWTAAHAALSQANHVRILGYSLPGTDAYIRYLLKSAAAEAPNLKTIDVICKGEIATENYRSFVNPNFLRLHSVGELQRYFTKVKEVTWRDGNSHGANRFICDSLERAHEEFMRF